ncbi:MAG: hypothetical protein JWQ40_1275 [Segetibacter sp.]|nr:hypothetical protein [Segetibacter sp.]
MNEIADDLSMSKASLYYYFPDKLNLYAAVLQKILEAEEVNRAVFMNEQDPLQALSKYLDNRTEFIIKYYNILEHLKTIGVAVPKELEPFFSSARSREIANIASIIAKGVELNLLKVDEPKKIAELLLDCLQGLRLSVISHRSNFFPDKKQFYELATREKEVAKIFIKGLSS